MEKEKEVQKENERTGILVESKVLPDETTVEFYHDPREGMYNYYVKKNFRGDIIECEEIYPNEEVAAMRIYFADHGIALTDEDMENIKEKFIAMQEDKKLDEMLNDIDENKSIKQ